MGVGRRRPPRPPFTGARRPSTSVGVRAPPTSGSGGRRRSRWVGAGPGGSRTLRARGRTGGHASAGTPSSRSPAAPRRNRWAPSWRANRIARAFPGIASMSSGATSAGFPSGHRRATRARPGAGSSIWCRSHPGNVHPWDTAAESPQEAAAAYETLLREHFAEPSGIPRFDLVLLGMGDDGHTASLFPNTGALVADGRLAVANYVPRMDASTADAHRAGAQRRPRDPLPGRWSGKGRHARSGPGGSGAAGEFPAQLIRPALPDSRLCWLVDEDAGAQLLRRDS